MTVDEIFGKLSVHGVEGMMIHDQLAKYYDFLNLHGFKRVHEYHFLCETIAHRKLHRYFTNRYNRLVTDSPVDSSSVIPESWYRYKRQEVDKATKRSAIEKGFAEWVKWETETRELYNEMYHELEELGEYSAAEYVCNMIRDVDKELKCAERKQIELEAVDYDMVFISQKQCKLHDKYKKKVKELGL